MVEKALSLTNSTLRELDSAAEIQAATELLTALHSKLSYARIVCSGNNYICDLEGSVKRKGKSSKGAVLMLLTKCVLVLYREKSKIELNTAAEFPYAEISKINNLDFTLHCWSDGGAKVSFDFTATSQEQKELFIRQFRTCSTLSYYSPNVKIAVKIPRLYVQTHNDTDIFIQLYKKNELTASIKKDMICIISDSCENLGACIETYLASHRNTF